MSTTRTLGVPAAIAGVVAGLVVVFVLGFVQVSDSVAFPVAIGIGVAVWLVARARRRRRERRAGRSPDAVQQARDRAVVEANGGRRFFVAQNPVGRRSAAGHLPTS